MPKKNYSSDTTRLATEHELVQIQNHAGGGNRLFDSGCTDCFVVNKEIKGVISTEKGGVHQDGRDGHDVQSILSLLL